jgi:hypothetical protein
LVCALTIHGKINKWWPVASAMPKMIKELMKNKELGLIHAESWFGQTTIMLQYGNHSKNWKLMLRIKMHNIYLHGSNSTKMWQAMVM